MLTSRDGLPSPRQFNAGRRRYIARVTIYHHRWHCIIMLGLIFLEMLLQSSIYQVPLSSLILLYSTISSPPHTYQGRRATVISYHFPSQDIKLAAESGNSPCLNYIKLEVDHVIGTPNFHDILSFHDFYFTSTSLNVHVKQYLLIC